MFFSRLHLSGNIHVKPTVLVPPTSFGYVRPHSVNMELYDQHYIMECFLGVKVSNIKSEAPPHHLQKIVNSLCGCLQCSHLLQYSFPNTLCMSQCQYSVLRLLGIWISSTPQCSKENTVRSCVCFCPQMKAWASVCSGGWVKFMPHFFT